MNVNVMDVTPLQQTTCKPNNHLLPQQFRKSPTPQENSSGNRVRNVVLPLSHEQIDLIREIERITGDTWSRGHFTNIVRTFDEQTIYTALSITKEKISLESGVNGGAYFTSTVKCLRGLRTVRSSPPSHPAPPSGPMHSRGSTVGKNNISGTVDLTLKGDEIDDIKRGWSTLYRSGYPDQALRVISRCLGGCDIKSLWEKLSNERPEDPEESVFEELMDLACLKLEAAWAQRAA